VLNESWKVSWRGTLTFTDSDVQPSRKQKWLCSEKKNPANSGRKPFIIPTGRKLAILTTYHASARGIRGLLLLDSLKH